MSRIIAGSAGGRRLTMPAGASTRPTTDRVREAFFSSLAAWLGTSEQPAAHQLEGVAFLDLFAGSGAVGLEASSRGAGRVVCVEADPRTCEVIRDNVRATGLRADIVRDRAERYLVDRSPATAVGGFDVVWLDPPYPVPDDDIDRMIDQLVAGHWLRPDGLIVIERSARSRTPGFPAGIEAWQRRYGETVLHHAQVDAPGPDEESHEP